MQEEFKAELNNKDSSADSMHSSPDEHDPMHGSDFLEEEEMEDMMMGSDGIGEMNFPVVNVKEGGSAEKSSKRARPTSATVANQIQSRDTLSLA